MIEVAVVIPIYKPDLTDSEIKSFKQCLLVLANHPLILIGPNGLDTSLYESLAGRNLQYIPFSKKYFTSVMGYSELLLNKKFYCQFEAYKYILIYQLDAWIFKDDLSYWCQQNYDYIGAPWIISYNLLSKNPLHINNLLNNKVGNGGLTLRKIKPHMQWAWWVSLLFKLHAQNEDVLWSLAVPFKKPDLFKALHFAFELNPKKCYERIGNHLPFGCHAWQKYEPEFWKQFI